MADINFKYKTSKHNISTYDGTLETYEWLKNCFEYVFDSVADLRIGTSIDFESGNACYKCSSIEEFKKYAFGKEITINNLFISASDNSKIYCILAHIYVRDNPDEKEQSFTITSNDELIIANIKEALDGEKIKQQGEQIIINNFEDGSVNIGNNNTIIKSPMNSGNKIFIGSSSSEEKWYKKVAWEIIIPILVTIVGAALCAWLGLA